MGKRNATRAGADALVELFRYIDAQTKQQMEARDDDDDDDVRDYVAVSSAIESSIMAHVVNAAPAHKEGYLRALADMFCILVDGCAPDLLGRDWDPLKATEAAFIAPREMRDILARMQT